MWKVQERRHLFSLDATGTEGFAVAPSWWSRCQGAGPGPPVHFAAGRALPWERRDKEPGLGVRRAAEGSSGSLCGDAPGAEMSGRVRLRDLERHRDLLKLGSDSGSALVEN